MSKMLAKRNATPPTLPSEHIIMDLRAPTGWRYWAIALAPLSLFVGLIWWSAASSEALEPERKSASEVTP
jgi:hypothetical protein